MPLSIVNYGRAKESLKIAWQKNRDPNKLELLVKDIVSEYGSSLLIGPRPYSENSCENMLRTFIYDTCKSLKYELHRETAFYQDDNKSFYEFVVKPLNEQIVSMYIEKCISEGYTCTDDIIEEIKRFDASTNITRVDKNRVHFEIIE